MEDLRCVAHRNKCRDLRSDLILLAGDDSVAHAVSAGIAVERCSGRLPAGIPDRIAILNIEVMSVRIERRVVVAITCEAEKLGVFIKSVSAAGIGNQCEEFFTAEIIDPGKRCLWGCDYILFFLIVEMTVFHVWLLCLNRT